MTVIIKPAIAVAVFAILMYVAFSFVFGVYEKKYKVWYRSPGNRYSNLYGSMIVEAYSANEAKKIVQKCLKDHFTNWNEYEIIKVEKPV